MLKILIKNGKIVDPKNNIHRKADLLVEEGVIKEIGDNLSVENVKVIDATDKIVTPGLIDIHVHLRDPGFPDKETIQTGGESAAAGGFTSIVCMPNTMPTIDSVETLDYVLEKGMQESPVRLYSSASITKGLQGDCLVNFDELHKKGAVTFTDDGKSVMDSTLLLQAFRNAASEDYLISSHCEDHTLIKAGAYNQGEISQQIGDSGINRLGEELIVARDILYAEETGARLHIQHVTTERAVQLIREAKKRGVRVTAEAAPHHFSTTDEIILEVGTLAKVNPPLRTKADVDAVILGLADGTLDAIATDHAPHTMEEKAQHFTKAPFGLIGLETSVGLTFTHLVHTGKLNLMDAIAKMTCEPARIMNLPGGDLSVGGQADITIIDPHYKWRVEASAFRSKARNTPFNGWELTGKAVTTIVGGKIVYQENPLTV